MKKCLPLLIIVSSLFLLFPSIVRAEKMPVNLRYYDWSSTVEQNKQPVLGAATSSVNLYRFNRYFLVGNLTPETPFYLVKRIQENFALVTTFNKVEKEKLRVAIAAERLSEAEKLAEKGNSFGLNFVGSAYEQAMTDVTADLKNLQEQKVNVGDLLNLVDLETAKHTVILEKVLVLAPKEAKEAIEKAREASWEGTDTVADLTGRPAVPPDAASRIAALKAQGLLTEEEANKLIGVKTRSEAREEFKKYVEEGIVPESDFLRLNENLKTYYPDEFYQIHETKRFYALKKLEEQKPDQQTLEKIQEFAKNYQSGQTVPPELRKYWGPMVQLEELQSTIRPDLVDPSLFKNNPEDDKKFREIIERYKPRPEDVAFLNNYLVNNSKMADNLPPEYERMKNLAEKFGAQCGQGMKWITRGNTGFCAPEAAVDSAKAVNFNIEQKNCSQVITSAKSPEGFCSVFPSSCLPAGWTKAEACTELPKTQTSPKPVSCPSNSHFVPVYGSGNGYCVPNYTPVAGGASETACPAGYHRNYQNGPCLADFSEKMASDKGYLPPITVNPGNYPAPFYPTAQRCLNNQYWVTEPINPQGGYCMGSTSGSCPQGQYQGPGGVCTSADKSQEAWKCSQSGKFWDGNECRDSMGSTNQITCPAGQYFSTNSRTCVVPDNYNSPSRETQEANCRAGGGVCVSWVNGACGCERPGSVSGCRPPSGGCTQGQWWDQASCSCRSSNSYPSACSEPSGGCGQGQWWDRGTCTCRPPCSAGTSWNGSRCMSDTEPVNTNTPPQGYGSCGYGYYWNGSICVTSSSGTSGSSGMSRETQEQGCRNAGGTCSWNGDYCNCQGMTGSGGSSSSSTPAPQPNTPAPETPSSQPASPPPTPAPATNTQPSVCPAGQHQDNGVCVPD